jgi:spore coat protein CotH
MILLSCKRDTAYTNYVVNTITPIGTEKYLTESSDFIFDQNQLHTFELTIKESELERIDDNPAAEEYVEANLKFNEEELGPVGVRYKGSIGSFVNAVSGNDWSNPSGHKTATKISMKVKIDWRDSTRTFYGLKKLQFHSQNMDKSKMHERLGYWLYREMGVIAPRSVHARLVVNGVFQGVFALTEQIDEQFIAYNYKDTSGSLYKEVWPLDYLGVATSKEDLLEGLKTNKTVQFNINMMQDFANEIVQVNNAELKTLIQKRMDLDQIISYIVVDRMIRNDDGAFHWYCDETGCGNHNYYWYGEPANGKMHLIPWDLDNAFQNIGDGKLPITRIHNDWGEISNDCSPFDSYQHGVQQKSAACDKLTGGWASFNYKYASIKKAFNNGPFSEKVVNQKLDEWSRQIQNSVIEASDLHGDAIDEDDWNESLENLREELKHSRIDY